MTDRQISESAALTDWVAAVLCRDPNAVQRLTESSSAEFIKAADRHGVLFLVERILRDSAWRDTIPVEISEALSPRVRCEQSVELVRQAELRRVVEALHRAGVPSIVFKGAALAYLQYPYAHLRPRLDTDILVGPGNQTRAGKVLEDLDYERVNAVGRSAIFTQSAFSKPGVGAVHHVIDLHWSLSNRPLFRDLFSFDELNAHVVPIPALGREARTLDAVQAMLLACIHPVAHHHGDWPLIWLYDVALLGERLDALEWARFRELATNRKVSFVCRRTFELVSTHLGERGWMQESGMLSVPDERRFEEPSAAFLDQINTARQDLVLDLRATKGARKRVHLLLSHAFPDTKYMRAAYGASGWFGLGAAYTRRIVNACVKVMVAAKAASSRLHESRDAVDA